MKIGVQLPNETLGRDFLAIRDFAQTAEGLGFSHLLLYEHVLGVEHVGRNPPLAVPYDEHTEFHEPMVLLGYLAAVTSSIDFATGVLVLPQRQTALVAKQAAEIDLLSGGRLRLGVGVGHNYVEYQGLNQDFTTRGARQEEQIEVLRKLWTEPLVEFHGRWHDIDRAAIAPRPVTPIPIWIGGFSEAAYRLCGADRRRVHLVAHRHRGVGRGSPWDDQVHASLDRRGRQRSDTFGTDSSSPLIFRRTSSPVSSTPGGMPI